jgi:hypothetical protein
VELPWDRVLAGAGKGQDAGAFGFDFQGHQDSGSCCNGRCFKDVCADAHTCFYRDGCRLGPLRYLSLTVTCGLVPRVCACVERLQVVADVC